MKMQNFNLRTSLLALTACAVVFSSCQKEDTNPASVNLNTPEKRVIEDKQVKDRMVQLANEAPSLAVYNSTMDKVIIFDPNNAKDGFNFSSPNDGWNFSNTEDVQFVENPNGGGILFVGPGAFGSNAGGGTVVAGESQLNINHAFCFSASEEAIGMDLFSLTDDIDGISGVIGIAGDFEALTTGNLDSTANVFDYFQGFAAYYVYDNEAQGSYNILDWFENEGMEEENFDHEGFAYVIDFQDAGIYFSSEGTLEVSGGSMNFDGKYFAILDLFEDLLTGEGGEEVTEPEFYEVDGFGTMGCD